METASERARKFMDFAQRAIDFFLKSKQWDGIASRTEIDEWLANFDNEVGQYYALRILAYLLYYSERDMERMLRVGIEDILRHDVLIRRQIENDFRLSQSDLNQEREQALAQTLFVPVKDKGHPGDSSNQVARMLKHRVAIPERQIVEASLLDDDSGKMSRLVVFDDVLGTGKQFEEFWSSATVKSGELLSDWCSANQIAAYFLVLVAYEESVRRVEEKLDNISPKPMVLLNEEHRVFSETSMTWNSNEERQAARIFLGELLKAHGISLCGFGGLGFGVILHLTVPNWSLPMLWRDMQSWTPLVRRESSGGRTR